jgi:hypothetical protein
MKPYLKPTIPSNSKPSSVSLFLSEKHVEQEQMIVPFEPTDVRIFLRKIGEPSVLFGEKDSERRIRLRKIMALLKPFELSYLTKETKYTTSHDKIYKEEIFYSEASLEVKNTRTWLAKFSINNAYLRMTKNSWKHNNEEADSVHYNLTNNKFVNDLTEIADIRPLTCCSFTCDGDHLLTASLSGKLKVKLIDIFSQLFTSKAKK